MAELEINNTKELSEKLNELVKDPSINKPSEEEIQQAKKEFEDAREEWIKTTYKIGTPENASEFCNYIKHFILNRFMWQKDAWMGIIKLTEELNASELLIKGDKNKSLEMGYHALEFTYYILTNPAGMGLQAALDFESEQEQYSKITVEVAKQLEEARNKLKDIEFLQQKWGAYSQGFYLEIEPEEDPNSKKDEEDKEEVKE